MFINVCSPILHKIVGLKKVWALQVKAPNNVDHVTELQSQNTLMKK